MSLSKQWTIKIKSQWSWASQLQRVRQRVRPGTHAAFNDRFTCCCSPTCGCCTLLRGAHKLLVQLCYASICSYASTLLLCSKLCRHNSPRPIRQVPTEMLWSRRPTAATCMCSCVRVHANAHKPHRSAWPAQNDSVAILGLCRSFRILGWLWMKLISTVWQATHLYFIWKKGFSASCSRLCSPTFGHHADWSPDKSCFALYRFIVST